MKRLILSILFVICLSFQASALGPMMMLSGGGCIPDCTGLTDCQNFEGTGYDNSEAWSTSTSGSGAIDADAATSGAGSPSKWCDQALKVTSTAAAEQAYISNDADLNADDTTQIPIGYFRLEFVVDSHSLASGEYNSIMAVYNTGWDIAFRLYLRNVSGTLKLRINVYNDDIGQEYDSLTAIALDTRYRVEVKWDITNNLWAWRLDGVNQPNDVDASDPVESEGVNISVRGLDEVSIGHNVASNAGVTYFDRYGISTTGWIGDQ